MLVRTHILICDADSDRRAEIVSCFDLEEYRVNTVADLAQLRRVVEAETVDLVPIDIAAPGDGGFELAGELRHRPETGIILLGNSDDLIDRVAGHWNEGDGGAEGRNVDVRIGRLRHKIERNPQNSRSSGRRGETVMFSQANWRTPEHKAGEPMPNES